MTSRLALFDQTVNATLLQPVSSNQADLKAFKTRVKLRINEQRNATSGEKELKFELSRSDDYLFLFAGILNNEKYQTLADQLRLTVDFDTFPKTLIQHLLSKNIVHTPDEEARNRPGYHSIVVDNHEKSPEISITKDADNNFCTFELSTKTFINKCCMFSIKLSAVRGDKLITHLNNICESQAKKLNSYHETSEKLAKMKEKCKELEENNSRLQYSQEEFEQLTEKCQDLESDLALAKEDKVGLIQLAEEKEEDVKELQREIEELDEENKVVARMLEEEQEKSFELENRTRKFQQEIGKLKDDNRKLKRDLENMDARIKKNSTEQNVQSLDVRKLRELEADLKEKDEMVTSLTETIKGLRKELEEEKLKTKETMDSFEKLQTENETIKGRLAMYRTQRFSPVPGIPPVGLQNVTPSGYKTVLGPNSPYTNANPMRPLRDASSTINFQHTPNTTTTTNRFNFNDDTTGSSVTNTPRYPQ